MIDGLGSEELYVEEKPYSSISVLSIIFVRNILSCDELEPRFYSYLAE